MGFCTGRRSGIMRKEGRFINKQYHSSVQGYKSLIKSYQAEAEFGYNKANEWHYLKDGKYPEHSNRVLVFTDEGVGFGIYGLDNKKWYTYNVKKLQGA